MQGKWLRRKLRRGTALLAGASMVAGVTALVPTATASAQTETLKLWVGDPVSPQTMPYIQDLVNVFDKAHKGVTVTVNLLSDANAHQQYITAIAGNSEPCVGLVGNTWTPEFAGLGALTPLPTSAARLKQTYVASMVDSATYKSKVYGYPYDVGVRAFIYRKDLFAKAHLSPPKTWSQVLTDGQKIQAANPGVYGFGIIGGNQWYYLPMVWEWGSQIATAQGGKWVSNLSSAKATAAYQFYANLLYKYKLAPASASSWQGSDADQAFSLGQLAMMVAGTFDLQAILQSKPALKSKIGSELIPTGPAGNDDTFAGGSNLAIFRDCPYKQTAQQLISFLLENQHVTHLTTQLGLFPATISGVSSQMRPGAAYSSALWKPFAVQVAHTRSVPEASTWGAVEASNDLINAMQALMTGANASTTMGQLAHEVTTTLNGKTS